MSAQLVLQNLECSQKPHLLKLYLKQEPQFSRSVLEREKRKYNVNIYLEAISHYFQTSILSLPL